MTVHLEHSGESAVVVVRGRLTVALAGSFRDALLQALTASKRVEVALDGVGEADLSLVQLVCAAHRAAATRSIEFVVTGLEAAAAVRRLLRESGAQRGEGCPEGCPWPGVADGVACPGGGGGMRRWL